MGVEGMTLIKKWQSTNKIVYRAADSVVPSGSTIQLIYVPNPETLETGFLGMFCL